MQGTTNHTIVVCGAQYDAPTNTDHTLATVGCGRAPFMSRLMHLGVVSTSAVQPGKRNGVEGAQERAVTMANWREALYSGEVG